MDPRAAESWGLNGAVKPGSVSVWRGGDAAGLMSPLTVHYAVSGTATTPIRDCLLKRLRFKRLLSPPNPLTALAQQLPNPTRHRK